MSKLLEGSPIAQNRDKNLAQHACLVVFEEGTTALVSEFAQKRMMNKHPIIFLMQIMTFVLCDFLTGRHYGLA